MRSFYSLLALAALVLVAGPAAAQTALVQVVHNAADPAAAVVDIYIEEVSTTEPAIPAFAFREATPFITLPAGTPLTVTVAPGGSTGAGDGLASFPFTLDEGETYQLIANGVLNPAAFAPNPNGVATGFTLFVNATGRTASTDPAQVQFNVLHGATDAPAVDVTARGVGTLVPGAAYGDLTAYLGAPAGNYLLDITPAGAPETLVATFRADLSGAAGAALSVLASGFLNPAANQDGPGFGLLAVFPDGTTALLPQETEARVQVIHNAPDPAAAVVDVYIEEVSTTTPAIPAFAFRAATPYLALPANTPLTLSVAPGGSAGAGDALASFPVTLLPGATYSVVASGVLDPTAFAANPDGRATGFTLLVDDAAQTEASDAEQVQFSVVHGSPDAPTVNVVARDVATLVTGAAYTDVTGYIGVPPGAYTLDIATTDGGVTAATFQTDLSGAAGAAIKVLASGFLSPAANQNGPAFGLLAVFADGTTALLPAGAVSAEGGASAPAAFAVEGLFPNPVSASATVRFSLSADAEVGLAVFDVLGREVLRLAPEAVAAGAERSLAVNASGLPAGAYVYRLTARTAGETLVQTGRLAVVR